MEQQTYAVPREERRRRSLFGDATRFRRTALGLCLIAGPLVAWIGGLIPQWEAEGEAEETTAAYLQTLAESPVRAQVSAILLYFGFLLTAVGILGIIHLLRHRSVVLGHIGAVLAIWGWVTLPGLLVTDFYAMSLAEYGNRQDAIAISDRAGSYVGGAILGIPVLLGMVGLVLLGLALWRAKLAPVWVPVLLLANVVQNFVAPPGTVSWAVGMAPLFVALGYVGLKIVRMSDDEWERGVSPVAGPVGAGARPRVQ